ncbi:hypothetical protein ANO11243_036460 [Dothideomycetidae sp. 11243]|nr:hypothetical protein ANO11243_036460 [fungal sp. No.11243]
MLLEKSQAPAYLLLTIQEWLGRVVIEGVDAAYSLDGEPLLKNINLTIEHGQKIAICGRTGSGKSSLASALFGLLDIRAGRVLMDDVDITKVSQDDLRSRLVALPQHPFFLPGTTVRRNLAIGRSGGATEDAELLSALTKVGLKDKFSELATALGLVSALDVPLNPAEALTKGQQQLFAFARCLLSMGQIVVMDEATAALDAVSEALVQRLVREEFKDRTVVAVAHRLGTIMDFDVVVVMDAGRIVEVGNPAELAKKEGGWFHGLVQALS